MIFSSEELRKTIIDHTRDCIESLSELEHVRLRPSMYIGDVATSGLHRLVDEALYNSLDEALAGFATEISVTVHRDGSVTVEDNGRGIPVDIRPDLGVSTLEGVMTKLKFVGKPIKDAFWNRRGICGLGIAVVNFLSEWARVEVYRDGFQYFQEYERGEPKAPVVKGLKSDKYGTKTTFKPDPEIFLNTKFQYGILYGRLRDLAFLNPNIKINFLDERDGRGETFQFKNGLADFVAYLNKSHRPIHNDVIRVHGGRDGVTVDIALQYTDNDSETIRAYVNNVHVREDGTHVDGFRTALAKVLGAYGVKENLFDKTIPTLKDFREGLTVVISARVPDPIFEGQTKTKLGDVEVAEIVREVFANAMTKYLEEHPNNAKAIVKRAVLAQETRIKSGIRIGPCGPRHAKLEREPNLRECDSRDVDRCELFLVEGSAAGGSAETGRIREFQAILPLRRKVFYAHKARGLDVLLHEEARDIINAFGAGYGDEMDLSKRRYGKIVIVTDANADGSRVRTILLTFFYRQMRALIEAGFLYVARPPLFHVRKKGEDASKARYVRTEEEMKRELIDLGVRSAEFGSRVSPTALREADEKGFQIARFKGLGEMDPEELRETTLNPENRTLVQVTMEDAEAADELFRVLMGEEAEPRREFIEKHALDAKNLDV
ncbi:MAG: DNA topoisomerase IV subunit B [Thermoguttaceae bacterium]|nr:DNA topoisomerase IV subunit B [Thermoguttaceae bacterium]